MLLNAQIKKIEVGFEFSPFNSDRGCRDDLRMDKAWVSFAADMKIFNQKDKEVNKHIFKFSSRKTDFGSPPESQSGVLDICLNRITLDLVREIKKIITNDIPWYISIEMDDKAISSNQKEA